MVICTNSFLNLYVDDCKTTLVIIVDWFLHACLSVVLLLDQNPTYFSKVLCILYIRNWYIACGNCGWNAYCGVTSCRVLDLIDKNLRCIGLDIDDCIRWFHDHRRNIGQRNGQSAIFNWPTTFYIDQSMLREVYLCSLYSRLVVPSHTAVIINGMMQKIRLGIRKQ